MKRPHRTACRPRFTPLIISSIALILAPAHKAAAQTRVVDPPVRLVVVLTLDQFQAPYFDRYSAEFTGGLKRLLAGGAYFTNAFQDHAITETAPAHATLLSGRFPRSTGIINDAADVVDATSPLIGGSGSSGGASPYRFRGSTLVDWLRLQDPQSRALSISRKPRSAILPLGRSHQPAYWFDNGRFTTSSWFADTLPAWVNAFNNRRIPMSYAGRSWDLLMPASAYAEPDSVRFEHGGRDYTFPHRMPADTTILREIVEYPVMDEITIAFALDGIRAMKLGAGRHTDILSLSLSTTDAVGHRFGPESREIHDQVLRVDRAVGMFMDSLYATLDSSRIVFAVTADHGMTSFPEVTNTGEQAAKDQHANMRPALNAARAALRSAGADTTAISFANGMVRVNRARLAPGFDFQPALDAFAKIARAHPAVTSVMRRADLAKMDTVKNSGVRRWLHTLPDDNNAELLLTVRPGAIWGSGADAEHGTPTDADAHIPMLFYGVMFKAGRYNEFARSVDIAPTLASVVGVKPLEKIDGRVLEQAIRK